MGWFPLGTRKQGSRPFAAPTPPTNRNGAGLKAGPAPPLPQACPRTLTAGRHMVIKGGALSAVRAQCNYLGVWPY